MTEPIRLYQNNVTDHENPIEHVCSICLDNLNNNKELHTLQECNHQFHSSCLITWLRINNGCPMCRGIDERQHNFRQRNGTILRHIISFCRSKKNKCAKLKRFYNKYKNRRDEYKSKNDIMCKFKQDNKILLKEYRNIRSQRWSAWFKFLRIKNEIASLPIQQINRQ